MLCAGPSDALLTAGNLTAGKNFDSGSVCANSVKAFVYVKNDCILPARAVINVSRRAHQTANSSNSNKDVPDGWPHMCACIGPTMYKIVWCPQTAELCIY